ncbi:unnamed protein product [Cladocopium goreaui]|uniref:Leucine-rich repeat domain-containing protein n=1 Tax=Cladocopium goreaui TaxID=2562237 RepID=A0A9P1CN00_9DINO|nr:unnamed protein product [Cladocopium goreaui]
MLAVAPRHPVSLQFISGAVEVFNVTSWCRVYELKQRVKDAWSWADQLEKDPTTVIFMANGQELKDEEKILERSLETMDSNISVYFSLHQAECGSHSEAAELGLQLESIQVLRIPQLTAIESKAFAGSGCAVVKLVIPDSVKIIGPNAFRNCDRLEAVKLPESLMEIGSGAFRGCKSLKRIVIPESVTVIEAETFYGCEALREVILPQFCQSIGRFAFEDCKQLVGIDIPDTVTFIGPAAFRACPLRSLKIPKNVTEIECCLCQDCCSLERVDFPETLTAIGAASFEDCSSLKRVQIPSWVTRIDDCAFEGTAIESVFVPRWAVLDHPFPAKTSIFISQAEKAWLG